MAFLLLLICKPFRPVVQTPQVMGGSYMNRLKLTAISAEDRKDPEATR